MSRLLSSYGVFLFVVARVASVRPPDDAENSVWTNQDRGEAPVPPSNSKDASFVEVSTKSMKMIHDDATAGRSNHSRIGNRAQRADNDARPDPDGTPTNVTCGISLIHFYGYKLSEGTFTAEFVLTSKWIDSRTGALVDAAGKSESLTLSEESAKQQIWMPEFGVINRNLKGMEQLSMSVIITKSDNSVFVEKRVLAVLKNQFDVRNFPFDSQTLTVVLSSAKYFSDELIINMFPPGSKFESTVKDDAFDGTPMRFKNSDSESYQEPIVGAGSLTRSRGRLQVVVQHNPARFLMTIASPGLFLVMTSYMVFWFPVLTPFVMPRLTTSVISYMSLMQVSAKYDAMISGAGASWGDTYIHAFCTLMFLTVVVNIAIESIAHQLKAPEFAEQMNNEMKYIFPLISLVCMVLCTFIGACGSIAPIVITVGYGYRCFKELVKLGVIKRAIPEEASADGKGQDNDDSSDDRDQPAATGPY